MRFGEILQDRPGSSERRPLRIALARQVEDELDVMRERRRRGKAAKKARGGYVGGHRIRRKYGFALVELQGRWEYRPIPAEQEVVARMRAGCPNGRGYEAMARQPNSERVPTVDGGPWRRQAVRAIVLRGPENFQVVNGAGHIARGDVNACENLANISAAAKGR